MSTASLDAGSSVTRSDGSSDDSSAAAPIPSAAQARRVDDFGLIDRQKTLQFQWDGRAYAGHPGDTLASALMANGVDVVARSFKYHRPRGIMSAGVEEGGALVTVGAGARRTPNVNAATCPLYDGLEAHGQNAWPSVRRDFGAVNNLFSRFFGAGFYYKTFFSFFPTTPRGTGHWMQFEKLIRRAAGMGRASRAVDPDHYEVAHGFCDALVIGSGPAGLAAARRLGEAGLDVVLVEQDFELGGRLLTDGAPIDGADPVQWRTETLAALAAAGVRVMPRTAAFGLYDGGVVGLVEQVLAPGAAAAPDPERSDVRERTWVLRTDHIVLATGAIERSVAFGDNDRPGVMTAGAVRAYLNRFGVLAGKRIAVATNDDSGYAGLERLVRAGAQVTLLDSREDEAAPTPEIEGVRRIAGAAPMRALGAARVRALETARAQYSAEGGGWTSGPRLDCDLVAVAGGWSPVIHLACHRGARPVWDEARAAFLVDRKVEAIEICGAAGGAASTEACVASGRNAAARILGQTEEPAPPALAGRAPRSLYEVQVRGKSLKSFIDPQHDVTAKDVRQARSEGYVSVEHLKRYTTLGMAVDQGKNGNVLGLGILAEAEGRGVGDARPGPGSGGPLTTKFRPPYAPVSIGAMAGRGRGAHFRPERRTPMHGWHLSHGAKMTDAGLWKRPWYYPLGGETIDDAYVREMIGVRETVGICDVSTLGKIAVQGPDATAFLDRLYVNGFAKLAVGRARYGVMLRDDGVVFDDGTVWRMGERDYFMTTTTAGAGAVMRRLEELLQVRWPELKVAIATESDAWAGFAVAGPQARAVLRAVVDDVVFDDEAFPFMGVREGHIGDAPVRIARISFSGELAYEIYSRSEHGTALGDALWAAAEPLKGVLYGTEALGGLRVEKGHVAGPELDGRTTLADLGLGGMASKKKTFIGQVLSRRPATAAEDRQAFVGLEPAEEGGVFKAGAVLCKPDATAEGVAKHGLGRVTSVTHSPEKGHWLGVGLVEGGLAAWRDQELVAADPARGKSTRVRVVSPHFIDPENARVKSTEMGAPPPERAAPETLARRSALGSIVDAAERRMFGRAATLEDPLTPTRQDGDRPAWLVEADAEPLWRVAAWPEQQAPVEAALAEAAQSAGAPAPRRFERGANGARLLRMGPLEWWLAGAAPARREALQARLAAEDAGAALDIASGQTRIRLGGPKAAATLNRFVAVDLRPGRFDVGSVAGAMMHHTPVAFAKIAEDAFDIWLPRSFAHSLYELLEETARQF